ncbi:energy transducer TonB [Prevotella sp. 10(H)]|uniref:energy transducer TonB n=1 Tax=Prevotella sp. 10(H) TaxID=1158294 RepID=UPI0004A75B98|nr:energy transducer TonB [Prevotella sp. 10(H)]
MKFAFKIVGLLLSTLIFSLNTKANENLIKTDTIIYLAHKNKLYHNPVKSNTNEFVDEDPEIAGGDKIMEEFFDSNLKYPEDVNPDSLTNKGVLLKFVVTDKGRIKDIGVVWGLNPVYNAEAVRVMKQLPKMIPGKIKGKAVNTLTTYMVVFKKIDLKPQEKIVERMPSFPGGEAGLIEFLKNNLQYPHKAIIDKVEGRVLVRFVVGKDGQIRDVELIKGISPECDAEAMWVVKAMPPWEPGELKGGEPVSVFFTIPMVFRLPKESPSIIPMRRR